MCYWNWPWVLPITASNFCWVQVTKLIWMVAKSYSWEEAPMSNLICVISYADGSAISVRPLTCSQSDAKTKAKSVLIKRMQDVKHLSEPVQISCLHRPAPWAQHSHGPGIKQWGLSPAELNCHCAGKVLENNSGINWDVPLCLFISFNPQEDSKCHCVTASS